MKIRMFFISAMVALSTIHLSAFAQETPAVPAGGGGMPSGRSAKMAARLKYYPPNNYLKHYLGDDRYKIAGGVWKVVSTQLDTYYHRPNCPNVLRQHADIVIGFSHSKDAEEAGYRADSVCRPKEETVIYGQIQRSFTGYLSSATRVTLADGSSSVTVPTGWARVSSNSADHRGLRINRDVFKRKGARGEVSITTLTFPGLNFESLLGTIMTQNPSKHNATGGFGQQWGQIQAGMAATNPEGQGELGAINKAKKIRWAGSVAYSLKMPKSTMNFGGKVINTPASNVIVGAKGSKIYDFRDNDGTKGALVIRNSFRTQ